MFAFNYIKAPVFNNYLIYISNKLDWVFFFIFRFNLVNLYLLHYNRQSKENFHFDTEF